MAYSTLKKNLLYSFFLLLATSLYAQAPPVMPMHEHASGPLNFVENNGQWDEKVLFKTNFEGNNTLFIEENGYTVLLTSQEDLEKIHRLHRQPKPERATMSIRQHAYQVRFLNSQPAVAKGIARRTAYHNYFLGNDPARWAGKVGQFGKVEQKGIYPGINLETYSQNGHLKYDLLIEPYADVTQIRWTYSGADSLQLSAGNLHIHTSLGTVVEMTPVAWQFIHDRRINVPCYFSLTDGVVSFSFPNGYDEARELVIDPVIVASTMTGTSGISTSLGNWGHSGTYDNAGNIYAAGISFVTTLPTTLGAFQTNWSGGTVDIAIVKYNPDGSQLIYATYIGGTSDEFPHSIVADLNQQLYIYGSTDSPDYPVTGNAIQTTPGGERDIIVTAINQDGTALVGSTYVGGSFDDGYNENTTSPTHSYGDEFRGEIFIDPQNNVYVVSNTQSSDFPVTPNAFDTNLHFSGFPVQDAVVFKANSDLSLLFWSTFLGGSGLDSGNGIRVDDDKNVYVTGTAGGNNFPTTNGTVMPIWPGGNECGYIAKLSANGSSLLASTFFGTTGNDNAYFLDLDEDDQVHIFGKTTGNIPIFPADVYRVNPGSKQFLAAFSNNLSQTIYSTVIGNGNGTFNYDFIPVAFMVDKCNGIYFSGYEAEMGLPVTAGSFPDLVPFANDFYLGVLTPQAKDLLYATYYGEADHVDGGTSRFDKSGVVYQAVCSCDWSGNLTTLPNAWATGQQTGCDIGVYKIDLEIDAINANGVALPATSGCAPFEVDFVYTGTNAIDFAWHIDGTLVSQSPTHTYTFNNAGSYDVLLIAANPAACNQVDSFFLEIDVLDGESTLTDTTLCTGDALYLDATTPNGIYTWQDGTTGATYSVNQPGTYWVDINIGGCSRRDSFLVDANSTIMIDLGPDTSFCDVANFMLDASTIGIESYLWQNGSTAPVLLASEDGLYTVSGIDTNGCTVTEDINLIFGDTPDFSLGNDTTLCHNTTLTVSVPIAGVSATWHNGSTAPTFTISEAGIYWLELNDAGCKASDSIAIEYFTPILPNATGSDILCASDCNGSVVAVPAGGSGTGYSFSWENGSNTSQQNNLCPGQYTLTITDSNQCTAETTVTVGAPAPLELSLIFENVDCPGDQNGLIQINSLSGGVAPYRYTFNGETTENITVIYNLSGGTYEVVVQDANGCLVAETVVINEPSPFVIDAGPDVFLELGESTQFNARVLPFSNQSVSWQPTDFLDCSDCLEPTLCPTETMLYLLTVTDPESGCYQTDSLLVSVDKNRNIYIPNAFSPNEDGFNDLFYIFAGNGVERIEELRIFDRWGGLVFENYNFQPNTPLAGWNGSAKGQKLNPAVYVYQVKALFKDGVSMSYQGDLNLIR